MCLGQIKRNVENNVIRTTREFTRDMMLMFVNAVMYNNHEYDVYSMAMEMCNDVMAIIEVRFWTGDTQPSTVKAM